MKCDDNDYYTALINSISFAISPFIYDNSMEMHEVYLR